MSEFQEIRLQKQHLNRFRISDRSFEIFALSISNASKTKPVIYSFRGLGFYAMQELNAIMSPRKYFEDIVKIVLPLKCVQEKRIFIYVERKSENKKNPFLVYDLRQDLRLPVAYSEHAFSGSEVCVFVREKKVGH